MQDHRNEGSGTHPAAAGRTCVSAAAPQALRWASAPTDFRGGSVRKSHAAGQLQRTTVAAADFVNTDKEQAAGVVGMCFTEISGELFLGRVTSPQRLYAQAAPGRTQSRDASYLYVHGQSQEAVYNTFELFIHTNSRSFLP